MYLENSSHRKTVVHYTYIHLTLALASAHAVLPIIPSSSPLQLHSTIVRSGRQPVLRRTPSPRATSMRAEVPELGSAVECTTRRTQVQCFTVDYHANAQWDLYTLHIFVYAAPTQRFLCTGGCCQSRRSHIKIMFPSRVDTTVSSTPGNLLHALCS